MLSEKKLQAKQKDYSRYPFMNLSLEDMKGEKWKDIREFDGYIKISNLGRIWSLPRLVQTSNGKQYYTKERIRKQAIIRCYNSFTRDSREYLAVAIGYKGKKYRFAVNRLVFDYFVKPIRSKEAKLWVVHKDGDNCNNKPDNLTLMNTTELYSHELKSNRRPPSFTSAKKRKPAIVWSEKNSPRPIVKYALSGKKIQEYKSVEQAAKANKTYRSSIRAVAKKKVRQLYGFVYRYKGQPYKGEYIGFSIAKPVTQYSLEGRKIATYPSVTEAGLQTGINPGSIGQCARRKKKICNGYVWRYSGDSYHGEYNGKITTLARPIVQYSMSGKVIARFTSVNRASLETGFSASTLSDCALRRSRMSHGYVWRFHGDIYKGEYKNYRIGQPVTQFTLGGKKIRSYPTIRDAAINVGLTPRAIEQTIKRKNKVARGFLWMLATPMEISQLPVVRAAPHNSSGKKIVQYSLDGKRVAEYSSISQAAKAFKLSLGAISYAVDKHDYTSAGFVWRTKGNPYRGHLAGKISPKKAVTQYSLQGRKIKVYESISEAHQSTGIASTTISQVANGRLKTAGGFIWKLNDGLKRINVEEHYASYREAIKRMSKAVLKYSLTGEIIKEYPSIAAAARAEKISIQRISLVINGKSKSAVGHFWKLRNK